MLLYVRLENEIKHAIYGKNLIDSYLRKYYIGNTGLYHDIVGLMYKYMLCRTLLFCDLWYLTRGSF